MNTTSITTVMLLLMNMNITMIIMLIIAPSCRIGYQEAARLRVTSPPVWGAPLAWANL